MIRSASPSAILALVALLGLAAAPMAHAQDRPSTYVGGLKLVWGSVPLPQFSPGLGSNLDYGSAPEQSLAPAYSLTLSTPDDGPEQFSFSPRVPQLTPDSTTPASGGRRTYLGFSIDLGEPKTGLFGTLGLGGSVPTNRQPSFDDGAGPRALNAPLLLHGGFELGYRADAQNTFTLSIDRAMPAEGDHADALGGVRLRYGLKF